MTRFVTLPVDDLDAIQCFLFVALVIALLWAAVELMPTDFKKNKRRK